MKSNSEQWLFGGDCKLCRRAKHCSKPCKIHREIIRREVYNIIDRMTGKVLSSVESAYRRDY